MVGWGLRVSLRYAASVRRHFFLGEGLLRISTSQVYAKSRVLHVAWRAGAPIGRLPLPLVGPRVRCPRTFIDGLTGEARRGMAARLFTGDLDLAAYSGNWDLTRRNVPSRACAYCWRHFHGPPSVEDEWHLFLICPLYSSLRRSMPFTAEDLCVEGHDQQGQGCSRRNLQSLISAILQSNRVEFLIDYLIKAFKLRKSYR